MKKKIVGSGGGGGKGGGGSSHVPSEDTDSLQSKAFARVVDLVCEGEIVGLVNGLESVYLDGTPMANPDGSRNFSGVTYETRVGTQAQEYIAGYASSESENNVGVEVKQYIIAGDAGSGSGAVVRSITNELVDAVRVRISMPQMTEQDATTGDLKGSEVTYSIYLQANGGGYVLKTTDTVKGKSTSKYERAYRIELEGDGPWDIKVERSTADATSVAIQNKTYWESFTEVIDGKLRYPNSALVAMTIDSSQFSSIPTRGYDMKLLKIRVPSNYDPETREYDGTWDGDFQIAWTDNPAWIFYDILTTERYGLGGFISEDQVDKWSLYTIGRYCDEMIDDGLGGTEPRFSCNVYLQTRAEAYKVLQDLASVFRGMVYWVGGSITAVQDSPSDPTHMFTSANVVDGYFNYSGSSAKARHTVALVSWNDPDDLYRQKIEYVENVEGITRYGVIETSAYAFGCTSRGQANRVGRWLLYTEQYQTEVVTFRTGLSGSICAPGEVIKIADPVRAGTRRGGRIVDNSDSHTINIDQGGLDIDPSTHTITVLLPDSTLETLQISTANGSEIKVTTSFSTTLPVGTLWIIQSTEIEAQLFKVISVAEAGGGLFEVTAISHREDKYDYVENDLLLEPRSISSLSSVPDTPGGILLTETLYEVNGDVRVKVTVSWNHVSGASNYIVQYKRDEGNIIALPQTMTNEIEILNAEPGLYTVTIYAINPLGVKSTPGTGSRQIVGKAYPPGSVSGFSLIPMGPTVAYLSWEKATDLDVLIGGSVRIRFSPLNSGAEWKNAVDIAPGLAGSATRAQVPLLAGTYLAKFVDSSGNASNVERTITTTVPDAIPRNVVVTVTEDPTFLGTSTGMEYSPSLGGLALSAGLLIDAITDDVDDLPNWDFAGGVLTEGEYEFADVVDLGEIYTSRVTVGVKVGAVDIGDVIDLRTSLVDDWADLDGDFIDDVNAELQVATSDDGMDWTDWKRFFVGEYTAQYFKFRVLATSGNVDHNIVIYELSVTVDMPDRVVQMAGLTSGAGSYAVTFTEAFKVTPAIGITAFNLVSGDYWQISSNSRTGFDIVFRNAAAAAVSRNFDVIAKGYGREQ